MYKKHDLINTPSQDTIIWKYMDLWKFLDLIDNKKLYLNRVDLFEDNLEGLFPERNYFSDIINEPLKKLRINKFITCFTSCNTENYAMWKIYTNPEYGIALKSNTKRLIKSLSNEEKEILIGEVEYLDIENITTPFHIDNKQIFINCFTKRTYFEYEKEIRLYLDIKENTNNIKGLKIKINITDFIEEIYISPFATESFKKLIELKLKESNLNIPIYKSKI